MNVARYITKEVLAWAASLKGFLVLFLAYGVIEMILYQFASNIALFGKDVGFYYGEGSFRGDYIYTLKAVVASFYAIFLIAFHLKSVKESITEKYLLVDAADILVEVYKTIRSIMIKLANPLFYSVAVALVLLLAGVKGNAANALVLPSLALSFIAGYEHLLEKVLFPNAWGGLGGFEKVIAVCLPHTTICLCIGIERALILVGNCIADRAAKIKANAEVIILEESNDK